MLQLSNAVRYWLTLIALALSLTACGATLPPLPADCPANPPPPALSAPAPQVSYSLSAAEAIKSWRARLTGTPLTP